MDGRVFQVRSIIFHHIDIDMNRFNVIPHTSKLATDHSPTNQEGKNQSYPIFYKYFNQSNPIFNIFRYHAAGATRRSSVLTEAFGV